MPRPVTFCTAEGCTEQNSSHGLCRRHSPVQQAKRVYLPEHPLADSQGIVKQHRRVLFDAIGPGEHECHWCHRPVVWRATGKTRLAVDHLDGDTLNNDPVNLVPSCIPCNAQRGVFGNPVDFVPQHRSAVAFRAAHAA